MTDAGQQILTNPSVTLPTSLNFFVSSCDTQLFLCCHVWCRRRWSFLWATDQNDCNQTLIHLTFTTCENKAIISSYFYWEELRILEFSPVAAAKGWLLMDNEFHIRNSNFHHNASDIECLPRYLCVHNALVFWTFSSLFHPIQGTTDCFTPSGGGPTRYDIKSSQMVSFMIVRISANNVALSLFRSSTNGIGCSRALFSITVR